MSKYLVVPDGVVEGYERYGREREASSTRNDDNGVAKTEKSAIPDPKRPRLRSPNKKEHQAVKKTSTPLLEARCCNCSQNDTCGTKRCHCKKSDKLCVSCACLTNCNNHYCVEIKTKGNIGKTATERARTEDLPPPGLARKLNQSLADTVPWQHRTASMDRPLKIQPHLNVLQDSQ
jgi:hypothetical protein